MQTTVWAQPWWRTQLRIHQGINETYNRQARKCIQIYGPYHYNEPKEWILQTPANRAHLSYPPIRRTMSCLGLLSQWQASSLAQATTWACWQRTHGLFISLVSGNRWGASDSRAKHSNGRLRGRVWPPSPCRHSQLRPAKMSTKRCHHRVNISSGPVKEWI